IARIMINKPAPGMARKLVIALKGTGVKQIELMLEDGTTLDSATGEDEEDAAAEAPAPQPAAAPVQDFPGMISWRAIPPAPQAAAPAGFIDPDQEPEQQADAPEASSENGAPD